MGHHVWYLLSFRSTGAVVVPTDGGLNVGACAVGGRTNHMQLAALQANKKKGNPPGGGGRGGREFL